MATASWAEASWDSSSSTPSGGRWVLDSAAAWFRIGDLLTVEPKISATPSSSYGSDYSQLSRYRVPCPRYRPGGSQVERKFLPFDTSGDPDRDHRPLANAADGFTPRNGRPERSPSSFTLKAHYGFRSPLTPMPRDQ